MKYRYVGILDFKLAKKLNIEEHKNKPILVFDDRIEHIKDNHLNYFGSEKRIITIF